MVKPPARRRRRLDRAIALWEQAIDREPGVASNHAALAAALSGAGRLDLAAQQYERAAALGGSADVYRQLAAIYGKLGRSDDSARAHARYERALLVPPSDKDRR
jgi:tetratricopeptide (TPR) repeat protein